MDLNHDGRLDRYELEQALKAFSNKEDVAEVQNLVDEVMGGMDLDHTGTVEYSEFLAAAVDHSRLLTSSRLESAFKVSCGWAAYSFLTLTAVDLLSWTNYERYWMGKFPTPTGKPSAPKLIRTTTSKSISTSSSEWCEGSKRRHMMNESTWL